MSLEGLGEEEAVKKALEILAGEWKCRALPPGDDATCAGEGYEDIVVKIDGYSVEAARLPWNSFEDVGWKAVTGTASDLAAKAAKPLVFLLSLGLRSSRRVEDYLALVRGASLSARAHGAWLGGGDTNSSPGERGEWIDVAGVGVALKPLPLKCGLRGEVDVYTTTGRIGLTGAAYRLIGKPYAEDALEQWPRIREETSRPVARIGFASLVETLGDCILCSSDVSDGLSYTLYRLAEGAGASIRLDRLAVEEEAREYARVYGARLEELALYGGEEYEVVFFALKECPVREEAEYHGLAVEKIGVARPGDPLVVYRGRVVERKRWDQFRGFTA